MSERRKIKRLSPLVVRTEFPHGEDQTTGYMTNLSETGAFLATDAELNVGETIQLHFELPWGLGEHDATASIVWRTGDMKQDSPESIPAGVGLRFTEIDTGVKEGVRRYMQRFFELLAQMEAQGLNEVLAKLARNSSGTDVTH